MFTSDFDYHLPEELIAQFPPERRDASRMMVLDRITGNCEIRGFADIAEYLRPGDCVVVNNTKVMRARFFGLKAETGAKIEILLTMPLDDGANLWKSLIKPGKRVRKGTVIELIPNDAWDETERERDGEEECSIRRTAPFLNNQYLIANEVENGNEGDLDGLGGCVTLGRDARDRNRDGCATLVVESVNGDGTFDVSFNPPITESIERKYGHTPLPPYIKRSDEVADTDRYQTVFAKEAGAVAAPTAGLHFTEDILAELATKGVEKAEVTLHVGPGTFRPVSVDDPDDHKMHSERFTLTRENAEIINRTRTNGGRVFAVGTTSVRVLETCCADPNGAVRAMSGTTDIFLRPPARPKVTDMLLTNFHLPKSTLLMLVATFADREHVLAAYEAAKLAEFRFFSYGDCMLLK